jgi:hypothetical protein
MKNLGVTPIEFTELRDFIVDALKNTGQDVSRFTIACRLLDFRDAGFSLTSMHNYVKWAECRGEGDEAILATLMHDINGMHESCFCPRTSSY